jgi:NAD(P)H dehydrogenase (quinone)
MNVLIVHAHPEPQSFTASMLKTAVAELTAAGHQVEVSDLYAMDFNPVAAADDFGSRKNPEYLVYALEQRFNYEAGTLAADIAGEVEKLKRADLVIFNFPVYWFSVPAMMKGWIDRVLISGLCYGGLRFYDQGGLKGKKAALSFTLGGRPHMFGEGAIHGELELMLRPLLRGTLAYTGMDVLPYFAGYHIPYLKPEARDEIMQQYRDWLAALPTATPLEFVKMGDFDEKLYPKA